MAGPGGISGAGASTSAAALTKLTGGNKADGGGATGAPSGAAAEAVTALSTKLPSTTRPNVAEASTTSVLTSTGTPGNGSGGSDVDHDGDVDVPGNALSADEGVGSGSDHGDSNGDGVPDNALSAEGADDHLIPGFPPIFGRNGQNDGRVGDGDDDGSIVPGHEGAFSSDGIRDLIFGRNGQGTPINPGGIEMPDDAFGRNGQGTPIRPGDAATTARFGRNGQGWDDDDTIDIVAESGGLADAYDLLAGRPDGRAASEAGARLAGAFAGDDNGRNGQNDTIDPPTDFDAKFAEQLLRSAAAGLADEAEAAEKSKPGKIEVPEDPSAENMVIAAADEAGIELTQEQLADPAVQAVLTKIATEIEDRPEGNLRYILRTASERIEPGMSPEQIAQIVLEASGLSAGRNGQN